ncbi:hypothetical protein [Campylobacter troglodytis]|nr:hypothetical protein [Campylobacter troglodytis]
MSNQYYTLNIYDKKSKQVATITNKNTKNIVNVLSHTPPPLSL